MTCFEAHVTNEHVFISCNMQQIPSEASSNSTVKKRGIRGPNPNNYKKRLSSPYRPHRLWGPSSLLLKWVPGSFPEGEEAKCRGVMLATHSHLVVRLRMNEWSCTSNLPACIHGVGRGSFTFTFTSYGS